MIFGRGAFRLGCKSAHTIGGLGARNVAEHLGGGAYFQTRNEKQANVFEIAKRVLNQIISVPISIAVCQCFDSLYQKDLKHDQVKLVIEFFSMKFKRMDKKVLIIREVEIPKQPTISNSRSSLMMSDIAAREATDVLFSFQKTIYCRHGNFQENLLLVERF